MINHRSCRLCLVCCMFEFERKKKKDMRKDENDLRSYFSFVLSSYIDWEKHYIDRDKTQENSF